MIVVALHVDTVLVVMITAGVVRLGTITTVVRLSHTHLARHLQCVAVLLLRLSMTTHLHATPDMQRILTELHHHVVVTPMTLTQMDMVVSLMVDHQVPVHVGIVVMKAVTTVGVTGNYHSIFSQPIPCLQMASIWMGELGAA